MHPPHLPASPPPLPSALVGPLSTAAGHLPRRGGPVFGGTTRHGLQVGCRRRGASSSGCRLVVAVGCVDGGRASTLRLAQEAALARLRRGAYLFQ
ncbi:hypothetical protein E2562_034956 [Oryza meyeriana var. granulata]|uniref:Uncharacterized protein n=1 Tax=Oryza meyeriana var. granulata TaxID=110450 RepID=A0A6G1DA72_9ORYZ|nr:hypothetical protein E2562_034956 [Oryza meyeriana var. granulata]